MKLIQTCQLCGGESTVEVDEEKYALWQQGLKDGKSAATHGVQVIFADKTADERETILSGIHGECWDKLFGAEE